MQLFLLCRWSAWEHVHAGILFREKPRVLSIEKKIAIGELGVELYVSLKTPLTSVTTPAACTFLQFKSCIHRGGELSLRKGLKILVMFLVIKCLLIRLLTNKTHIYAAGLP